MSFKGTPAAGIFSNRSLRSLAASGGIKQESSRSDTLHASTLLASTHQLLSPHCQLLIA